MTLCPWAQMTPPCKGSLHPKRVPHAKTCLSSGLLLERHCVLIPPRSTCHLLRQTPGVICFVNFQVSSSYSNFQDLGKPVLRKHSALELWLEGFLLLRLRNSPLDAVAAIRGETRKHPYPCFVPSSVRQWESICVHP